MLVHLDSAARFDAVIFDLDGTLLNTLDDLADSVNRVLENNGYPTHLRDTYRIYVGDGAKTLVTRALPPDQREPAIVHHCLAQFLATYGENWDRKTCLYEGIADMLDRIAEIGLRQAILTNKPDALAQRCAQRYFAPWRFDAVVGQRDGVPTKPDPTSALWIARQLGVEAERVVYLGDSAVDIHTAIAARMAPAGALWGFRTEPELREAGARWLLRAPKDFAELVASIGSER